jgi:putative ABC transport system substrate-binding protein
MRRRTFITLIGGAAAWPIAARGQQLTPVGYIDLGSAEPRAHLAAAFRRGLSEYGYIEGRNVAIEYRWAEGQYDRLSMLVSDLVHRQVAVIAAVGGTGTALAAKAAVPNTTPIVFATGSDPVKDGLVVSLNQPGGNTTGVSYFTADLGTKRLGMLHELVPGSGSVVALVNPNNPNSEPTTKELQAAASTIRRQIEIVYASNSREIGTAFATLVHQRAVALMTTPDALFTSRRTQIVTLAARHAIPAIFTSSEFAKAGGLMSYDTSLEQVYRQVGIYTGRILKGEKPRDLPVQRPTKFEFIVNLQTAQALGIDIPPALLARADEVIE